MSTPHLYIEVSSIMLAVVVSHLLYGFFFLPPPLPPLTMLERGFVAAPILLHQHCMWGGRGGGRCVARGGELKFCRGWMATSLLKFFALYFPVAFLKFFALYFQVAF